MDLRRLRPGEYVMTAAAAALVVSLFLPWFGLAACISSEGVTACSPVQQALTAWEAFSVVDVVLVACAAVALLAVFLQATQQTPALPIVSSVAAVWAGLVAVVLVAIKVIDGSDVRYGAWIGLAAAVGLAAGSWWAMRDERPGLRVRRSHLESSG
jgi:hypothetical protein